MSDSVTSWTVAHQPPLPMELSRQEYWSGLPLPLQGIFPTRGSKPRSPRLQADSLPSEPLGKTICSTLKSNTQFILEESKGLNYIYQVEKRLSKPLKAVLRNSDIIFQIIGDQACISFIHLSNALWSPFYGGKNRVHLQA